eukprot:1186573-Prorocentrum_minimum.AAC.6
MYCTPFCLAVLKSCVAAVKRGGDGGAGIASVELEVQFDTSMLPSDVTIYVAGPQYTSQVSPLEVEVDGVWTAVPLAASYAGLPGGTLRVSFSPAAQATNVSGGSGVSTWKIVGECLWMMPLQGREVVWTRPQTLTPRGIVHTAPSHLEISYIPHPHRHDPRSMAFGLSRGVRYAWGDSPCCPGFDISVAPCPPGITKPLNIRPNTIEWVSTCSM